LFLPTIATRTRRDRTDQKKN